MILQNYNYVWVIVWTIVVFNSTYEVYLAGDKFLPYLRNSVKKSGVIGSILNRGRDDSNLNWKFIRDIYFGNHLLVLFCYTLFSWVFKSRLNISTTAWTSISPILSLLYVWTCSRSIIVILMFCLLPIAFWFIQCFKSKTLSWISTVAFLYMTGQSLFFNTVLIDIDGLPNMYLINSSVGWTLLRCISFSMEMIDQNIPSNIISLVHSYRYTYYFPRFSFGPFVDFDRFSQSVQYERENQFPYQRLLKIFIWAAISDISIHFLYFRYLASDTLFLERQNGWVLFGILYWLTQSFWLNLGVTYEFPSLAAMTDGVQMYNLPPCPGHMHKYSTNWRTLDPGLYRFLVKYIYSPVLSNLTVLNMSESSKKFIGSAFTFIFVMTYHGGTQGVIVWAAINFTISILETYTKDITFWMKEWRESGEIPHSYICSTWESVGLPLIEGILAIVSMLSNVIFIMDYSTGTTLMRLIVCKGYWMYFILTGYCFARTGNAITNK